MKEQKKKIATREPISIPVHDILAQKRTPVYLLLAVTVIMILYVRIIPYWHSDVPNPEKGEVIITDPDSCYHARRILYIAQHNMRLPFYDPLLAHPSGDIPIWSPLYDWISALPSYAISFGSPSDYLVLRTATIFTILLGLLGLFMVGLLIYKSTQSKVLAILSILLTGMTEPQIANTNIRMLDHNSILLFLFSLSLYWNFRLFSRENEIGLLRESIINGIIAAALFWAWPGSYIYVAAIMLMQIIYIILSRKGFLLKYYPVQYGIACILIIPLAFIHYELSGKALRFEYVSFLTALFFVMLALFFFALHSIAGIRTGQNKNIYRPEFLISLIALIGILIYISKPLVEGIRYANAQNKWLASVIESGSIFYTSSIGLKIFTLDKVIANFSYLIFLFPVAFVLIAFRLIRMSKELYSIIITTSVAMTILMLMQVKFAAEFSIPYGMALTLFIGACYQKLTHKTYANIFIAFVIPMVLFLSPYVKLFFTVRHTPLSIYYDAFKWLQKEARAPEFVINSSMQDKVIQRGSYGVLAPWQYGHFIQLYSQLPTLADNFGFIYMNNNPWQGFYDSAKFFVTDDENEAVRILKKNKCKYIVAPQPSTFETFPSLLGMNPADYVDYSVSVVNGDKIIKGNAKPKFFHTIGFRLSELYGSSNPYDHELIERVAALRHFRLIYELPGSVLEGISVPAGKLKIYTYTDGEKLTVPITGNFSYSLEGIILTNTGNTFYYRQEGNISDGIIVPYSTQKDAHYPYAQYYKAYINGSVYEFK